MPEQKALTALPCNAQSGISSNCDFNAVLSDGGDDCGRGLQCRQAF
jgi:hypothetical protein